MLSQDLVAALETLSKDDVSVEELTAHPHPLRSLPREQKRDSGPLAAHRTAARYARSGALRGEFPELRGELASGSAGDRQPLRKTRAPRIQGEAHVRKPQVARLQETGGVTLGERCVIGANSVVTRDLPPRVIAAGSPAKVIKEIDFAR